MSLAPASSSEARPVADVRTLGTTDDTRVGGYSLVTADDSEAAVVLAKGCPGLKWGGGVEVGEFMDLSPGSA